MRLFSSHLQQQQKPKGISVSARLFYGTAIVFKLSKETTRVPEIIRSTHCQLSVVCAKQGRIEASVTKTLDWYHFY